MYIVFNRVLWGQRNSLCHIDLQEEKSILDQIHTLFLHCMQLFFTADSFKKAIKKAKFGLFKMDAEIQLLTQAQELRADQHFD